MNEVLTTYSSYLYIIRVNGYDESDRKNVEETFHLVGITRKKAIDIVQDQCNAHNITVNNISIMQFDGVIVKTPTMLQLVDPFMSSLSEDGKQLDKFDF